MIKKRIILASSSPQRKKLLQMIGLKFKVAESKFEEDMSLSMNPHKLACFLSLQKAKYISGNYPKAIIIAADTFIVLGNRLFGKPQNYKEAKGILQVLNGKVHIVITGFTIINTETKKIASKSVETKVYFKKLAMQEIESYVKSGESLGGAGAYKIQGIASTFVEKIEGDFFNIVGLPIFALVKELKKFKVEVF